MINDISVNLKCELISPVHIGNGHQIPKNEFILEKDIFYKIDEDKLISGLSKNSLEKFTQAFISKKFPNLGEFLRTENLLRNLDEFKEYSIKSNVKRQEINNVGQFIGNNFGVYIPGSSVKGAIRTALLNYLLNSDKNLKEKIEKILLKMGYARTAINMAEAYLPKLDAEINLCDLKVSDSEIINFDKLSLDEIKILSLQKNNKLVEKKFGIFKECLNEKTTFDMIIRFSRDVVKDNDILKRTIIQACKNFSIDLIEHELHFFNLYFPDSSIQAFYNDLNKNLTRLSDNEFFLRLGWGEGYDSMSIGLALKKDKEKFIEIKKNLKFGRPYSDIFPKSRRLVYRNNYKPLGWVKFVVG